MSCRQVETCPYTNKVRLRALTEIALNPRRRVLFV